MEDAAEEDLEVRARSDKLIGLLNHRAVLERGSVPTSHPRRTGEEVLVLLDGVYELANALVIADNIRRVVPKPPTSA